MNESLYISLFIFGLISVLWVLIGWLLLTQSTFEKLERLPLYKAVIVLTLYLGPFWIFLLLPLGLTAYVISKVLKPVWDWLWEEEVKPREKSK